MGFKIKQKLSGGNFSSENEKEGQQKVSLNEDLKAVVWNDPAIFIICSHVQCISCNHSMSFKGD